MEVFLHLTANKYFNELDKKIQANIKAHLKNLSENPYSKRLDIKKIKGRQGKPDLFRLRVGEYRIIYSIQDGRIWVTEIILRGKGYEF